MCNKSCNFNELFIYYYSLLVRKYPNIHNTIMTCKEKLFRINGQCWSPTHEQLDRNIITYSTDVITGMTTVQVHSLPMSAKQSLT